MKKYPIIFSLLFILSCTESNFIKSETLALSKISLDSLQQESVGCSEKTHVVSLESNSNIVKLSKEDSLTLILYGKKWSCVDSDTYITRQLANDNDDQVKYRFEEISNRENIQYQTFSSALPAMCQRYKIILQRNKENTHELNAGVLGPSCIP